MIKKLSLFFILGFMFVFPKATFAQTATTLELFMVTAGEGNTFEETPANIDDRPTFSNTGIYNYSVILRDAQGNPVSNQPIKVIDRATGQQVALRCFNSNTAVNPTNCPPTTFTTPFLPLTDNEGKARFNINFTPNINKPPLIYAVFEGNNDYSASSSNKSSLKIGTTSQWCYYQSYDYSQPSNNNGLNKRLVVEKICKPSGVNNTYTVRVDLNVGDSFSKGEIRPCMINNSSQQCVIGNFKYYYNCSYTKCPQITVNYTNPNTPLACNNPIDTCGQSQQVCSGTQYSEPTGTLVMPIRSVNGNPATGVDPIQIACYSAVTESQANNTIRAWEVGSLGYSQSENNRSQVYPVACINDDDCKVSERCDTSKSWNQWACVPKQFSDPVRVFVSNSRYDANLGGLVGADAKCKAEADASSIPGMKGSNWKAWLSTSTVNAKDRISDGVYAMPDYTRVANNKSQLASGSFVNLITKNANGTVVGVLPDEPESNRVWTGTTTNGNKSTNTCADWNTPETVLGTYGIFTSRSVAWTESGTTDCGQRPQLGSANYRLYCFEDLTPPTTSPLGANAACQTGTQTRTEVEQGLISSTGLRGSFGNNLGANNTGACVISPNAAFVSFKIPTYSDLLAVHFTQARIDQSKKLVISAQGSTDPNQDQLTFNTKPLIHVQRNLNISGNPPGSANGPGVVFVDGNLNITQSYAYGKSSTNDASGSVFVVQGDVVIEPNVAEINAVIIAQGTIYTAGAGCETSSIQTPYQLIINGSLISLHDPYKNPTADTNAIKFCRVLTINPNNTRASEKINLQPKYLSILRNLFSTSIQKWAEIPGFKKILADQPANPEAVAPTSQAPTSKRMFVTRQKYGSNLTGGGSNGIVGANATCQASADEAGLGGKWKAWLSYYELVSVDSSIGPDYSIARNEAGAILNPNLPIRLVNGDLVVSSPSKLFDINSNQTFMQNRRNMNYIAANILQNPINIDQFGQRLPAGERAWTNVNYHGGDGYSMIRGAPGGGQEVASGTAHCGFWRGGPNPGSTGLTDTITDKWTDSWGQPDGLVSCDTTAHLYCFEVF